MRVRLYLNYAQIRHYPQFGQESLIKDGWLITDDPYLIQCRSAILYADLAAERPIAAERDGQKLVVEVKSFIGASKIQDLKEALGQYDPTFSRLFTTKSNICERKHQEIAE
jgi:hypothetical protein